MWYIEERGKLAVSTALLRHDLQLFFLPLSFALYMWTYACRTNTDSVINILIFFLFFFLSCVSFVGWWETEEIFPTLSLRRWVCCMFYFQSLSFHKKWYLAEALIVGLSFFFKIYILSVMWILFLFFFSRAQFADTHSSQCSQERSEKTRPKWCRVKGDNLWAASSDSSGAHSSP